MTPLRRIGLGVLLAGLVGTLLFLAFGGVFLDVYDKLVRTPADFVLIRGTSHIIDYMRAHREQVIRWHRLAGWIALGLSAVLAAVTWRITRESGGSAAAGAAGRPALAWRVARAGSVIVVVLLAAQAWAGLHCPWRDVYDARAFGAPSYWAHMDLLSLSLGLAVGVFLFALERVTRDPSGSEAQQAREARPAGSGWRDWAMGLGPAWGMFWRAGIICFLLEVAFIAAARPVALSASSVGALFVIAEAGLGVAFVGVAYACAVALHAAWRLAWSVTVRFLPPGPDAFALSAGAALCALLSAFLISTLFSPYQQLIFHLQLDTAAAALSVMAGVVVWYPLTDTLRRIAQRDGLRADALRLSGFLVVLAEAVGRLPLWPIEAAARWAAPGRAFVERAARGMSAAVLWALALVLGYLIEFHFNDFYRYFNLALGQWFFLMAVLIAARWGRRGPPQRSGTEAPRAGGQPCRWAAALRAILLIALVVSAERIFTAYDEVRFLCVERTELGRMAVISLRGRLDRDGDGFSGWLAGGDLDDGDARVHPVAGSYPLPPAPADFGRVKAAPGTTRPLPEGTNVFVLSIDALRWDAVGTYGYARPTTPSLDAFARECVVFERAYAQNSASYGSLNSLFMGRYTTRSFLPGKRQRRYLADILSERGYEVGLTLETESRAFGRFAAIWEGKEYLRQGTRDAPELIGRWLDQRPQGRPFLLWAHLIEPHYPFEFHPEVTDFGRSLRDVYDNEVAYADRTAGRLLDLFRARGLLERTIVVVTADHGESTGEHGTLYHGMNVYEEATRVPLMLRVPGVAPRRAAAPIAALIDLAPTIEDLLGVPSEAREPMHGLSLAPLLRDPAAGLERRWIFSQAGFLDTFGVIEDGRWKLVYNRSQNVTELYDLAEDPAERVNRADAEPARTNALMRVMIGFLLAGKGDWVDPDPFKSD